MPRGSQRAAGTQRQHRGASFRAHRLPVRLDAGRHPSDAKSLGLSLSSPRNGPLARSVLDGGFESKRGGLQALEAPPRPGAARGRRAGLRDAGKPGAPRVPPGSGGLRCPVRPRGLPSPAAARAPAFPAAPERGPGSEGGEKLPWALPRARGDALGPSLEGDGRERVGNHVREPPQARGGAAGAGPLPPWATGGARPPSPALPAALLLRSPVAC